jgi:RHS repeat-associated protein
MKHHSIRIFAFSCLILTLSSVAIAQVPTTGFPPYGSFENGKFDGINLQNLNVNFAIPIINTPGRGLSLNFGLIYDSATWYPSNVGWYPSPGSGWQVTSPAGTIYSSETTMRVKCGTIWEVNVRTYNVYYVDPAGTAHGFPIDYTEEGCSGGIIGTQRGYAGDGSGYFGSATEVISPSGITVVNGKMTDTNGNYISSTVNSNETDWYDTVGHSHANGTLRIITNTGNTQYEVLDVNGVYQTYQVNYTNYNVKTNFGCSGIAEYTSTSTVPYPSSISLPNGQSYTFTYETTPGNSGYITGRIQRVTLPTGGYYEYDYGSTNDGISCTDGSTVNFTRTISDGTNISTWTFTRAPSGSNWATTETAPKLPYDSAGNQTLYTFNSVGQEITRQIYEGSANLLRTINTTWATNGTPATQITILEDNSTQNEVETTYDTFGNLQVLKEHDWGTGAPGGVLRTTTNTFNTSSTYTNLNIMNLLMTQKIADSMGTIQSRTDIGYDTPADLNTPCITGIPQFSGSCSNTTRGLPTTVTTYPTDPVTPSGGIIKTFTYDSLGNLRTAQVNCCQEKTWNFSTATNYSYPDSVVSGSSAPQLTTSATYNAYTGQIATSTDENLQPTSYSYADPGHLNRLMSITRPDSAQITYSYNDTGNAFTLTTPVQGTNVVKQVSSYDGLGRTTTATVQDSSNNTYSIVATKYDPLGRAFETSNPYTTSAQYLTETEFDALGRATQVILPDNSKTTYSYAANTTTITDPAGKQRKTQVDGLARLAAVLEPDPTHGNSLTQQTTYTYSVLNALTNVSAVGGAQTRTYGYDHMGRLTSVATPEANNVAMQFQYNSFDLVAQRTDPRGVITTYGYDTLNRLHTVTYNVGTTGVAATAGITLTFGTTSAQNNNGRLITMADGVGSESYSYDILGRITQLQKIISSTTYTTSYQYNSASELIQLTYPSGRIVQQAVDTIGRLCAIAQTASSCTSTTNPFATNYGYNTAFQLTGFSYANGVAASFVYSPDRLLLTSLSYVKGTTTLYGLNYSYGSVGSNNGHIAGITDNVDNGRSTTYTYDALARLTAAVTTGSTAYPKWGLSFSYDPYGNRNAQTVTSGTAPMNSVAVSTATNRITSSGYAYDANGNMTNDGSNALTYDGENHLLTSNVSAGIYTYDGNGLRVKKVAGSTTTLYAFSGSKVIAEYVNGAAPTSPTREYVYSGGTLLAKIEAGATQYYHSDHLSTRLMTDSSGNKIGEQGHYPYGESWYASSTTTKWQFTTYERDAESGNDYAMARYHVNRLGRFSSLDPLSGSIANPQSLNRYTYVVSDAINLIDPFGLQDCDPTQTNCQGAGSGSDPPDQCNNQNCGSGTACNDSGCKNQTVVVVSSGPSLIDPEQDSIDNTQNGGVGGGGGAGAGAHARSAKKAPCIPPKSLPWDVRAELSVLSWMAQRSGGVRAVGAGATGAFSPESVGGGGASVQALWMTDYMGQQGLYWSVSAGPTAGQAGTGGVVGMQYMTSTFNTTVTVQDVVNSTVSMGAGAGAGFGVAAEYSPQTRVATVTVGFGGGGWGGASSLNLASGFIPLCKH